MMDAYHRDLWRARAEEVGEYVASKAGCTMVPGFSEIVELGDAVPGGDRVFGFTWTRDRREWYVPLTARRGLSWQTEAVPDEPLPRVAFIFSLGFGNGSPLPQPSGRWDIYVNDRFALSVRVVKHSQLWRQGACTLAFAAHRVEAAEPFGSLCLSSFATAESFAAAGPALLVVPASWIQPGAPAVIRVEASAEAASTRWLQLASTPLIVDNADIYRVVDMLTAGAPRIGGYNVHFGDIHTHSGQVLDEANNQGCGMGTREESYAYARGAGGLDFFALTDHEWQIDPKRAGDYLDLADHHNEDGRFVCLPGFEFTSLPYGHRNVYFRDAGGTVINATRGWGRPSIDPERAVTPAELWAALEKTGVKFMTVPHHPSATCHPLNWSILSPQHDRLVEVYSCWGSSEHYGASPRGVSDRFRTLDVRDALRRGAYLGFVASSDGHDGHPGNAQSPLVKHHHLFHHLGSGLTAVLGEELTRGAVFDALYDRRCYATTGVPILLSFSIGGQPMGSRLPALPQGRRPRLEVSCVGSWGIDHIRLIKDGHVVSTTHCHGEMAYELAWEDVQYSASQPCFYYVRLVQVDGESAWSSPIWVG